ncbi:hypothetical protein F4825DRAFT_403826 [Nemania diffusa]|nr:hypothetical protein F4825DRAFT_403826 [Nemania diffusa]
MEVPFLSVFVLLFALGLRITPALSAVPPRLGALDNAALLPVDAAGAAAGAAGIAPRWYMEGTPAIPAQLLSPNPRHLRSGYEFGARQVPACAAGQHSCVEANAPGFCCNNDSYCYLNSTWGAMCCSQGVTCPGSPCNSTQLYCNATSSATVAVATTTTAAPATEGQKGSVVTLTLTSSVSYTTVAECCSRACSSSSYSCESYYGGQCCPYEYRCGTGSLCIFDPAPSTTTTSVSTIVPEIPSGCSATSQFSCAQTDGGGCCGIGSVCVFQSRAPATSAAVCMQNRTLAESGSGGLSSGAKAGIGAGVAVGAAFVIAAATWLFIRRRHGKPQSGTAGTQRSAHEMQQNAAGSEGGRRGRQAAGDQGDSLLAGANTPRGLGFRSTFSDTSEAHRPGHLYSGPDAVEGPYTVLGDEGLNTGLATTPPVPGLSGDGAGDYYTPDFIQRPVEIGGEAHNDKEKDNGELVHIDETPAHDEDPPAGIFELMGSPGLPSPLNFNEEDDPMNKGPSSPPPAETGGK